MFQPYLPRGGPRAGKNRDYVIGSHLQKTFSLDRKAAATKRMHSNNLEAGMWDEVLLFLSPALSQKWGTLKLICQSVCLSIGYKNFNLAHIFWSINDRALIFGMHDPYYKPFVLVPCGEFDLWPTSRSNLLLGGDHISSNLLVGSIFYAFIVPRWATVALWTSCFNLSILTCMGPM